MDFLIIYKDELKGLKPGFKALSWASVNSNECLKDREAMLITVTTCHYRKILIPYTSW